MGNQIVSMEQHVCLVCAQPFDSGAILIAKRLNAKGGGNLENKTVTGWSLCPEHKELYEQGYLALVEARDNDGNAEQVQPADVYRLGRVVHIRHEVAVANFQGVRLFQKNGNRECVVFAPPEVIDMIEEVYNNLAVGQ